METENKMDNFIAELGVIAGGHNLRNFLHPIRLKVRKNAIWYYVLGTLFQEHNIQIELGISNNINNY